MLVILGHLYTCFRIVEKLQPRSESIHLLIPLHHGLGIIAGRSAFAIVLRLQELLRRPSRWEQISPFFTRFCLLSSRHSFSLSLKPTDRPSHRDCSTVIQTDRGGSLIYKIGRATPTGICRPLLFHQIINKLPFRLRPDYYTFQRFIVQKGTVIEL